MRMAECADVLVDVRTHRSWLTHSGYTHAWHSQPPPVPHAHADTCSHPGRHDAQVLPGPDSRPARRRLEIPIRPGLHKHGLETAGRTRGRVGEPSGQWGGGVPTLPRLALPSPCLCHEVSSGIFHFIEKPRDWEGREMSELKSQPLAGPPAPAWTFSLTREGASLSRDSRGSSCPLLQGIFR